MGKIKHFWPLILLIAVILIVYLTDIHNALTLENLRVQQDRLKDFATAHPVLSPLIYISFYIFSVILIIPDSTILTLIGGLVFPLPLAIFYAVFSETVGATLFFAIFYNVFGKSLIQRERPLLNKLRKEFTNHSPSYLLFLRLSHIFPFWLINVLAAYFKVNYKTFIWTCFVGVLPLTVVLADAGSSLSKLFDTKANITMSDIFTTEVKIALILSGIIALVPIIYKHFRHKKWWRKK